MVYAVQTGRPVARSRAFSQPWIPNSPPEAPTRTRFLTTKGAMGVVSPCETSAILAFHSSLPVVASIATVWPSSRL